MKPKIADKIEELKQKTVAAPRSGGPAKIRPNKPKLRSCRPPRGLCLMAGLHYPNAGLSGRG